MDEASEKKKLQDQIFGIIERITFHNPENGFTVAKIKQPRKKELTTLVGVLPVLQPGENVRCFGQWKQNPSHGIQFEVSECQIEAPADLEGIKRYLASGMVQGIGPVYAEKIVKKFGLQTLEIIDLSPDLLLEIEGLGEKRVEKIKSCWSAQKNIREVMIFLQSYGISPVFAQKVFKIYAEETKEVILANPYCLAKEIRGIGFKTADDIGQKLGFALHSNQRLDAGIEYVLQELSGEGHTCYPLESFLTKAQEILGVETSLLSERISMLEQEKIIIVKEGFIWSKSLYLAETGIAREIQRLLKERCSIRVIDVERALAWVEGQLRLELALHQKEAIQKSLQEKLHIITGGPGTGKSTIIKAILTITGMLTKRIILAAPTGRAAKRMTEITKKEASTIHSLLQYDFANGGFKRNREYPLDCDLLIVDEASMIDTSLMYHLLKAIPSGARVIFVGDIHQLPSVGPGNVLKDLIESEKIPITCLTEIFRQAAGSKIITNAHRILKGEFPDLRSEGGKSDFFFIKAQDPEQIKQTILNLVLHRLPRRYSLSFVNLFFTSSLLTAIPIACGDPTRMTNLLPRVTPV